MKEHNIEDEEPEQDKQDKVLAASLAVASSPSPPLLQKTQGLAAFLAAAPSASPPLQPFRFGSTEEFHKKVMECMMVEKEPLRLVHVVDGYIIPAEQMAVGSNSSEVNDDEEEESEWERKQGDSEEEEEEGEDEMHDGQDKEWHYKKCEPLKKGPRQSQRKQIPAAQVCSSSRKKGGRKSTFPPHIKQLLDEVSRFLVDSRCVM
jgi:hypothetical protein